MNILIIEHLICMADLCILNYNEIFLSQPNLFSTECRELWYFIMILILFRGYFDMIMSGFVVNSLALVPYNFLRFYLNQLKIYLIHVGSFSFMSYNYNYFWYCRRDEPVQISLKVENSLIRNSKCIQSF